MDAEASLRFLAEASIRLLSVPRLEDALEQVLRLAVPDLADWAVVDLVQPDGSLLTHATPVAGFDPTAVSDSAPVRLAMAAPAGPRIYADTPHQLGFVSVLVAPLVGAAGNIGALTLAVRELSRAYGEADLLLTAALARYFAIWSENGRLQRQAEDALRSRNQVLSMISHDLRTPLTTISGVVQLLLRRADQSLPVSSPQVMERLALVQRAAAQLESLIDEILDAVRLADGRRLELNPESTNLVQLVHRAAQNLEDGSEDSHVQINASVAQLNGWWDAGRLGRVLSKLLGNALRYSPPGAAVTVFLNRRETAEGRFLAEVTIRDEGPGIPAGELSNVLDRGHRREATRRGRGRLDLPGCRTIVEQHGGTLTVQSEVGKGTTFRLLLPLDD